MSKCFKVAAIAAVTAMLALPVFAQNATEELGPLESNTYKATSGLFGNDVDNFMDVHSYSDVALKSWFGFVTGRPLTVEGQASMGWVKPEGVEWDSTAGAYKAPTGFLPDNPTTGLLSLGFAKSFGSIYLGVWYQGNIAQVTGGDSTKTTSITPQYDAYRTLTETKEETTYNESWMNTSNQIEVLVGVAGMGIKVGFYESLFSNTHEGAAWRLNSGAVTEPNPDGHNINRDSADNYKVIAPVTRKTDQQNGIIKYENVTDEFYTKGGYMKPYIGWGGKFGFVRPYVNLGLTIKSDSKVDNWSDYTEANGTKFEVTSNIDSGYDFSYLKPQATVGAWFEFRGGDARNSTTLGIEYSLDLYLYGSSYEGTGLSGDKVSGTVAWPGVWGAARGPSHVNRTTNYFDRTVTDTDIQLNIDEISEMRHFITPTFILTGQPAEGLDLGFSASLPVGIRSYSSEKHSERHRITNTEYNTDKDKNTYTTDILKDQFQIMEESNLALALDLAIGASYKLIPDRFTVNAGVSARPLAFVNTVRTYKAPDNASIRTTKTTDGLGNVTTDTKNVTTMPSGGVANEDWLVQKDQVEINNVWDAFSGNVTGGFTFFINDKIALDLAAAWGKDSFGIDATSVDVLFSFKF
jgi:hypothetical protein